MDDFNANCRNNKCTYWSNNWNILMTIFGHGPHPSSGNPFSPYYESHWEYSQETQDRIRSVMTTDELQLQRPLLGSQLGNGRFSGRWFFILEHIWFHVGVAYPDEMHCIISHLHDTAFGNSCIWLLLESGCVLLNTSFHIFQKCTENDISYSLSPILMYFRIRSRGRCWD